MENIKISVLMPVYNTNKKYLKQSIESILKQTYKDFEFIIIDDGSDIKTKKFLKSFKDDRIVLIENEKNLGLIKTLNKGIKLAKGEFIARMDADDISTPDRFEKQLLYMTKNPEIGVLGSAFQIFQKREEKIVMPTTDEDAKKMLQTGVSPFAHPSVMIRKDLLEDVQYSETFKHCEDLALWAKLYDKTQFANLPDVLLKYRWHGNNVSKKHTFEQSLNTQTIIYLNMEKFFNQACGEEFAIIRKLKDGKRISTKEYRKLLEKEHLIEANKMFKKIAKQKCINPLVVFGILK